MNGEETGGAFEPPPLIICRSSAHLLLLSIVSGHACPDIACECKRFNFCVNGNGQAHEIQPVVGATAACWGLTRTHFRKTMPVKL